MIDGLSDLTARIRNAYAAGASEVRLPYSTLKEAVAQILAQEGYVAGVSTSGSQPFLELVISLKYVGKQPAVSGIRRLSTPGRRLYSSSRAVPKTLGGYGITIISTNKGVLSDSKARALNVGGELLCQVW